MKLEPLRSLVSLYVENDDLVIVTLTKGGSTNKDEWHQSHVSRKRGRRKANKMKYSWVNIPSLTSFRFRKASNDIYSNWGIYSMSSIYFSVCLILESLPCFGRDLNIDAFRSSRMSVLSTSTYRKKINCIATLWSFRIFTTSKHTKLVGLAHLLNWASKILDQFKSIHF